MANKGGSSHTKRLNAPRVAVLPNKKINKFLINTRAGPHKKDESVPLTVLIRDMLGLAQSAKEAKKIIQQGLVTIDGRKVTDEKRPVGLMDVVSFPAQKSNYILYIGRKNKLRSKEISDTKAKTKICKVVGKKAGKKGEIIVTLHDGKNIIVDNNIKVGDSVVLSLPSLKVTKLLKLEKGTNCYIMKGKHVGDVAQLQDFVQSGRTKQVILKTGENEFRTIVDYLFVLDDVELVN